MEQLPGLRSCERGATAFQATEACPENSKAGLKEAEAPVITFEESSDKMESTDLEANQNKKRHNGPLFLQVRGVSDKTVKYGYGFFATRITE
jgi:hypothetical protein